MYRMNPYNRSTPRDRLDPRMLERMSMQHHSGCGCGTAGNDMRNQDRSSCSMCDSDRSARSTERRETQMSTGEQMSCPMCRDERSARQEERSGCGCENNMESNMRSRERSENNSNRGGCGCAESDNEMRSREQTSPPMRRNERSMRQEERGGCGCENNMESNMRSRERAESNSDRCGCGCSERDTDMRSQERSICNGERSMRSEDREGYDCDRNTDTDNANFNYSLAMVYSPCQEWQNLYCEEEGMMAGTIFKELDKPFYGEKCHGGNGNV